MTENSDDLSRALAEIKRLKDLLGRYADSVEDAEGTDFLDEWWGSDSAETVEIRSYRKTVRRP